MDIKITVDAPGLVQAIENLAAALSNQTINPLPTSAPVKEEKKESVKKETPTKTEEPEDAVKDTVHSEEAKNDAPEITLVTVRAHLQKLQDAGRQKDAKAILVGLGHKKLSDVPETDYQKIIEKVEELLV